jgi:hypothetical protein
MQNASGASILKIPTQVTSLGWTDDTNILSDNGSYALHTGASDTDTLKVHTFDGADIPLTATVDSLMVLYQSTYVCGDCNEPVTVAVPLFERPNCSTWSFANFADAIDSIRYIDVSDTSKFGPVHINADNFSVIICSIGDALVTSISFDFLAVRVYYTESAATSARRRNLLTGDR